MKQHNKKLFSASGMAMMKYLQNVKNTGDTPKNASAAIESIISSSVSQSFTDGWDQTKLISALISGLKESIHLKSVQTQTGRYSIAVTSYKYREAFESSTIACIADVTYHDGQFLQGAHILDVQLRDLHKNSFSGIKKDLIKKIHSVSASSSILLLDYDPITGMAFSAAPEAIIGNGPHSWSNWIPYTKGSVIATSAAMALNTKTQSLYRASVPFSYFLIHRIFNGLDIDTGKSALDTALGHKKEKFIPSYIIYLQISYLQPAAQARIDSPSTSLYEEY